MSRQQLYQYAVIQHASPRDDDGKSTLVIEPTYVLANNDSEVVMIATRRIPGAMMDYPDRLEVAVRPF